MSSCNKNCEKCGFDKQHEVNEELLICPPVLNINLQRFKTEQRVNFHGRRKSLRLINNSQFQVDNVVSYGKNCQDVDPSPILLLKETVYSLRSVIIHLGSDLEEPGNHIVTLLNTSKGWITCNDTELSNPSTTLSPLGKQGYLFIYEKVDDPPVTMPNIQSSMPMNTKPVIENKEETEAKETFQYQETNLKPEKNHDCKVCKQNETGLLYHLRYNKECCEAYTFEEIDLIRSENRKNTNRNYSKNKKSEILKINKDYKQQNKHEIAEKMKRYKDKNRDEILKQKKDSRNKNRDNISEQMKTYRNEHKDEISEQMKTYREKKQR